jgi:hypothetical protein
MMTKKEGLIPIEECYHNYITDLEIVDYLDTSRGDFYKCNSLLVQGICEECGAKVEAVTDLVDLDDMDTVSYDWEVID